MKNSFSRAPRIGAVVMAYPNNGLGEEQAPAHVERLRNLIRDRGWEATLYPEAVLTDEAARAAGACLGEADVDVVLVLLSTFIPDYFLVELLDGCPRPVFLWCHEFSINSLSLVGGMLVTGGLHAIGVQYTMECGDLCDGEILRRFQDFAKGAMLKRRVRDLRIGVSAGKNNIMMSMAWDEFALKRSFGLNVINIALEEFYREARAIPDGEAAACWSEICSEIGKVTVPEADGLLSARYYLACLRLRDRYRLAGYSINCFPELKSKICLAVARMNDSGIAAGCEGDLNSTFLMLLLQMLSGNASFNGDFLWMYRDSNSILFSHCGAGAFSLAERAEDVRLIPSIETCDGCAVCYPTYARGDYTLLNLMTGRDGLRVFALRGEAVETDLEYSGTPIRIRFSRDIDAILADCVRLGTGHHWSGAAGDHVGAIRWLCEFMNVEFHEIS